MIRPKKKTLSKVISGQEDFATLDEYRSYLVSTLTCLQQQSPVFEQQDVLMPEQNTLVEDTLGEENLSNRTKFVKTGQEIRKQLMHDAHEVRYKIYWLLNDSPAPSLVQLGLRNHPDSERLSYHRRQPNSKPLVHNYSALENAMVDEFFNREECEKAIGDPDEVVLLFPDTSKNEIYDDITSMKYFIKYKLNVGPLPFSVHEPEPTQTQLNCLHAYIEAHLIPRGRHISRVRLRSKISKLHNMYKNLVQGTGEKLNYAHQMHVRKLMVDLLKKTWEQVEVIDID